jgi:hypothetical protein
MTRTGHPKRLVQLALSLFAIIVGVAYWFATKETIKPESELDEDTRQARRENAARITNLRLLASVRMCSEKGNDRLRRTYL